MTWESHFGRTRFATADPASVGLIGTVAHRFFWEAHELAAPGWVALTPNSLYLGVAGQTHRIAMGRFRFIDMPGPAALKLTTVDRSVDIHVASDVSQLEQIHSLISASALGIYRSCTDGRFDPSTTVRDAALQASRARWGDPDEGFLGNAAMIAGMAEYDLTSLWGIRRKLDDEILGTADLDRLGAEYARSIRAATTLADIAGTRMLMYMIGDYLFSYRRDLADQNGLSRVQNPMRIATLELIADGIVSMSALERLDTHERQFRQDMLRELGG